MRSLGARCVIECDWVGGLSSGVSSLKRFSCLFLSKVVFGCRSYSVPSVCDFCKSNQVQLAYLMEDGLSFVSILVNYRRFSFDEAACFSCISCRRAKQGTDKWLFVNVRVMCRVYLIQAKRSVVVSCRCLPRVSRLYGLASWIETGLNRPVGEASHVLA